MFTEIFKAFLLGIVEGFTEFLPISSTGHLIIAAHLLQFNIAAAKLFEIVIQSGAIFAVCFEYRQRLLSVAKNVVSERSAQNFVINLFIAFLPAAFVGLFTAHYIQQLLFSPIPVAIAFIVGALIILWVEKRVKKYPELIHLAEINQISRLDALKVGCMQVFALIPGTSRSCATIIGAMFLGWSRRLATEFSFFLAIPTIFAASLYSLYKDRALFHIIDWPVFIVGLITAFISAFICIRWLLRYVSTHSFTPFAWYRIVFGVALLAVSFNGRFVEF